MTPADLARLLDEADHAPWESVASALALAESAPLPRHPRLGWLISHLTQTKREYGRLIAGAAATPAPPDDAGLRRLLTWEVEQVRSLTPADLTRDLTYSGERLTVADLVRLNARHSVWHAGQIAALCARVPGA